MTSPGSPFPPRGSGTLARREPRAASVVHHPAEELLIEPPKCGRLCRLLIGSPLHNERETSERLSNPVALAILSSDALSSVAYATEEMLKVLVPVVGLAAFRLSLPIAAAIIALLILLVLSYRQTIKAYPNAGGAYVVTRDNFGLLPAQAAGVALLIDYIMTVAVSVSAAVAALYSYFPALFSVRLVLVIGFIWLIAWGNLRGVRVAGQIFAVPTYFFLLMIGALLAAGFVTGLRGGLHPLPPPSDIKTGEVAVPLLVLLHAYASGTTALTGVEAISNGVTVFRPLEWRNARKVLTWMGAILAVAFGGITLLAWRVHPLPNERKTVVSELGSVVFGKTQVGRVGLLLLQVATTAILVLAANTSFADFPRLSSFHASDGYLPRPLRRRGSRLVFSVGIVTLAVLATTVVLALGADVHRLIPLYAVGVFVSFTFSQLGMTRRHLRVREERWRRGLIINALGATGSGLASVAILITKFLHGAWVVTILVPGGVALFVAIHAHYQRVDAWLADPQSGRTAWRRVRVLVGLDRPDPTLESAARDYGQRLHATEMEVRPCWTRQQMNGLLADLQQVRRDETALSVVLVPLRRNAAQPGGWSPLATVARRARRNAQTALATLVVGQAGDRRRGSGGNICVVAIEAADARARRALALARLLGPDDIRAVLVDVDSEATQRTVEQWGLAGFDDVDLHVLPAPYRERAGPLRADIELLLGRGAEVVSLVLCPLLPRWWQRLLYVDDTATVRKALADQPGIAVVEHRLPLPTMHGRKPERERFAPQERRA